MLAGVSRQSSRLLGLQELTSSTDTTTKMCLFPPPQDLHLISITPWKADVGKNRVIFSITQRRSVLTFVSVRALPGKRWPSQVESLGENVTERQFAKL